MKKLVSHIIISVALLFTVFYASVTVASIIDADKIKNDPTLLRDAMIRNKKIYDEIHDYYADLRENTDIQSFDVDEETFVNYYYTNTITSSYMHDIYYACIIALSGGVIVGSVMYCIKRGEEEISAKLIKIYITILLMIVIFNFILPIRDFMDSKFVNGGILINIGIIAMISAIILLVNKFKKR